MRSYFLVAIGLLGGELVDGDFVGGEIVWWRDDGFIEGGGTTIVLSSQDQDKMGISDLYNISRQSSWIIEEPGSGIRDCHYEWDTEVREMFVQ